MRWQQLCPHCHRGQPRAAATLTAPLHATRGPTPWQRMQKQTLLSNPRLLMGWRHVDLHARPLRLVEPPPCNGLVGAPRALRRGVHTNAPVQPLRKVALSDQTSGDRLPPPLAPTTATLRRHITCTNAGGSGFVPFERCLCRAFRAAVPLHSQLQRADTAQQTRLRLVLVVGS